MCGGQPLRQLAATTPIAPQRSRMDVFPAAAVKQKSMRQRNVLLRRSSAKRVAVWYHVEESFDARIWHYMCSLAWLKVRLIEGVMNRRLLGRSAQKCSMQH